jgi:hypothetical protein
MVRLAPQLVERRLVVRAKDVVFVKGVVEAHDGLAHVFAEHGGDLTIAAPEDRAGELDELVDDLARELDGIGEDPARAKTEEARGDG